MRLSGLENYELTLHYGMAATIRQAGCDCGRALGGPVMSQPSLPPQFQVTRESARSKSPSDATIKNICCAPDAWLEIIEQLEMELKFCHCA